MLKTKMKTTKKSILLILLSSLCAGSAQIFWKNASFTLGFNLSALLNVYFIVGVLLYGLATIFMVLSFRGGELSVLHPFLATSYVWVTLISPFLVAGEIITPMGMIGVLAIFTGVILVGIGGGKSSGG